MSLVLGIDTGGTYTDAVIIDSTNKNIITESKALTTYEDLTIGIRNCIKALDTIYISKIQGVSLSTTLATNAIVEDRGGDVGLLIIGKELTGKFPTKYVKIIDGGHDVNGEIRKNLNIDQVKKSVEEFKGKVNSIAISSYFSIRNPEHEIIVKEIVKQILEVPVVCAHHLSSSLGFYERTVTAVLNAKLIPIIVNLIESVKEVFNEFEINAPLMIVKGDGSLMNEDLAQERPIETILSGPAASIIGATELSKYSDALVLDMGGTTTDIAILKDSIPRVNLEGAAVGGWNTRVKSVDINTYGIGGDSYIKINQNGEIGIGPQRVVPISVMASEYPYLIDELKSKSSSYKLSNFQATDCLMLINKNIKKDLDKKDMEVIRFLESGPHSISYLMNNLKRRFYFISFKRLLDKGIIVKISVTPTDILHVKGIYTKWNVDAARIAVGILADKTERTLEDFMNLAIEAICDKLCKNIFQSLLNYESNPIQINKSQEAQYFIEKILESNSKEIFSVSSKINLPIIAVGAPAQAYIPKVAEKLKTEIFIPHYAEVANAIGAATGKIIEKIEVIIKTTSEGDVILHTPWERKVFDELGEAKEYVLKDLKQQALLMTEKSGAIDCKSLINSRDFYIKPCKDGNDQLHVETRIEIITIGRPKW